MLRTLLRAAAKDNAFKGLAERLLKADEVARHLQQDTLENVPDVRPVEVRQVPLVLLVYLTSMLI